MNPIPATLPPAPLYPGYSGLYESDVYVATLEGCDVYWGPLGDDGTPSPMVVVVFGAIDGSSDSWNPNFEWISKYPIPESVKRFAESIYRLHV